MVRTRIQPFAPAPDLASFPAQDRQCVGAGIKHAPNLGETRLGRQRQVEFNQPGTHGVEQAVIRQASQDRGVQPVCLIASGGLEVDASKVAEKPLGDSHSSCRPGKRRLGLRPVGMQNREDTVTNEIAGMVDVRIAWIVDPAQPVLQCIGMNLMTPELKHRPQVPASCKWRQRGHGGQAAHPCSAHELEQEGFSLVISVVSREQHSTLLHPACQGSVASLPGGGFEPRSTRAGPNLDPLDDERDTKRPGGHFRVFGPMVGLGL